MEGLPGHLAKYNDFSIAGLPPNPTAGGFRHGAADTLAISVPATLAVQNTGHDLTNMSAMWEYLGVRAALLVPGAIVLAGWKALPYGQLGAGPALPKLQPVIDMGVSNERLESMIDTLFSLHDASPPMLLRSGHLRPMMRASMASMIMYYPERFEAKEMHVVLTSMREAYSTALSSANDSHQALIQWSAAIMSQFKLDNLHLTHVQGHDGTAQVVEAVRGLAATVGRMHDQVTDVATRVLAVESRLGVQHAGVNELIAGVNNLSVNLAAATATAAAITTAATAATAAPTAPVLAAAVAPVAQMMQREAADATSPPPPPLVSPRLASPPPPLVAPLTAEAPPTATAPADAFSILRQGASRGEGATLYTITGVAAPRFFLDCMANGGRLPAMDSRRMSDADLAFKAMMAMANAEEKTVLKAKPRDDAHAGGIANAVVTLVLKYIVYAYETALLTVPRSLKLVQDVATRPPLVSSIKEHITKLSLDIRPSTMSAWRLGPQQASAKRPAAEDGELSPQT